ncbi:far upstream element-binding protein 1 isoform X2 [Eupeodes corollae]|uniref:far upstream element-binding protein 1 isoform X2 n=1 Tax=Eupeodes corollae TaxID=290404 RepID=UPI002491C406|nr:far upstream element-binding protein 1 isoform X2 [Eupeodes corollae]
MSDYSTVAPPQSNINQSQAFAAALQRAKQIAAKIQPTGQQQQTQPQQLQGGGGYKRSLNDDDSAGPDAKKFSSPDSYNSQQGGNMSQALAQAAAVAARLAATAGNTTEEQLRIPEALVSHLVIGRNSSDNISHIQAESGCKIQLSQESERTVTVRGSRETVTKGREMIQQMATQHGAGTVEIVLSITMPPPGPTGYPPYQEIMVPGAKVGLVIGKGGETIKMLQEKTGAKMVIIQDGPNQEVIKPLRISGDFQKIEHAKMLVFELIQDKDSVRPGGGGFNNSNGSGGESAEVFVPKVAVGVVIGKGGDMIKKIQGETGCKLQFIQGKNDEPGDRRCIIQGSRQQVEDAKRMIEGLIESVMRSQQNNNRNNNAGGGGGGGGQQADNTNSNYGYGYGVNHTQQAAREEVTFSVPASKCGIVIGRGGETIKLINQQTGAYCEMDRSAVNPPSEKMFKAKGTPEQIEHARQMISEKINIDLVVLSRKPIGNAPNHQNNYNNNGGMQSDPNAAAYQQQWAGYAQQGGWDQSQQQQQQQMGAMPQASAAGQADYSSQWIEYYKSMGMHREAEMIEQQLKAKQVMAGAANPAMPAATPQMTPQPQVQPQQQQQVQQQQQQQHAQQQQQQQQQAGQAQAPDYSAQWAEYYRSIGKMEEAEAIEKQMKSGASNGQATASASVSAPTQPAAAAAAPQQPAAGGYPQGMTPSQYAQYSQYYAAAAAAGQPGGYPQQAYPGYGYPAGPQPGMPGGPQAAGAGGPPNPQQQQQQQPQQHKPSSKPNDKK